jgi:hypothetical protein
MNVLSGKYIGTLQYSLEKHDISPHEEPAQRWPYMVTQYLSSMKVKRPTPYRLERVKPEIGIRGVRTKQVACEVVVNARFDLFRKGVNP